MSWTIEKRDASYANILHNEFIPSGSSFMYIENKSGPSILMELQALFFSTQMFDHSKQLSIFKIVFE